jgi:phthiocerol/phenolphthiocerol synthesis type-I polyketide synthase E
VCAMNKPVAIIATSGKLLAHEQPNDVSLFDADFFGISAHEAQLVAPPHRLFLECAWGALESSCYSADCLPGKIGIYASVDADDHYFRRHLLAYPNLLRSFSEWQMQILTSCDLAPLWVSHKLNLNGPCLRISAGECSSIAALHIACQSLQNGDCDMAVAGGVGILEKPGAETDLRERRHDWRAGFVVLKRCADAIADRDSIQAVVRGSAFTRSGTDLVNNPSLSSIRQTVTDCHRKAGVEPETLAYIEVVTHRSCIGGAAIELLKEILGRDASRGRSGALNLFPDAPEDMGSLKGIGALIQVTQMLKQRAKSCGVNALSPRRAAVLAVGLAGTSAHIVLEEAPESSASGPSRPRQVLCLSAKSEQVLRDMAVNLRNYLNSHAEVDLADVAYSLQIGRKSFDYRRALVCGTMSDALEYLGAEHQNQAYSSLSGFAKRPVVFMFPGAGPQYVRMARDLYESEVFFRNTFNQCCEILRSQGIALNSALYPEDPNAGLYQTVHVLAALFAVEYSLAQLWMQWGVQPESMIGHSVGEYVAACLSGVFSLEDALKVVAFRGHLFETLPRGAMLSISIGESEVETFLGDEVSLAAINAPAHCVLSGSLDRMKEVQGELASRGVEARLLPVERAGHSTFVTPILDKFTKFVGEFRLGCPRIPYISNYTGTWIKETEATDPQYWAAHLRHTVRFSQGIEELLLSPDRVFLELGPGKTLSTFARQHMHSEESVILSSMRHVKDPQSDVEILLQTFAKLWAAGVHMDFPAFYSGEHRQRVSLPTYPFQRRRHWIDAARVPEETVHTAPNPSPQEYTEPRNEIEATIAGIWKEVLGTQHLSMDQSFCDLGGTEPLLQELQHRLRQEFGVSCRERCGLTSTISGLADLVAERGLEEISDEELSKTLGDLDLPTI